MGLGPYEDGVLLGTQLVGEHLRLFVADLQGFPVVVDESIGGLCPFEDNVRTVLTMIGEETAVQPLAFLFEYADSDIDACFL